MLSARVPTPQPPPSFPPEPQRPMVLPPAPGPSTSYSSVNVQVPPPDVVAERLLDQRIVHLAGTLDAAAADLVISQLLVLAAESGNRDITLYIRSREGSPEAALAVHDAIRHVSPRVTTWAAGLLGPEGTLIVASGEPGRRHAFPHARFRPARPEPGVRGLGAELLTALAALTGSILTGTVPAEPTWLSAEQAREHGLVDHVGS